MFQNEQQKRCNISKSNIPKKIGKPAIEYTQELAERICETIASSPYGLRQICKKNLWMPKKTVIYKWKINNPEFAAMYARARSLQVEVYVEDNINIIDGLAKEAKRNDISMTRVMIVKEQLSERRWQAAKLAHKLFGNKPEDVTADTGKIININFNQLAPKA